MLVGATAESGPMGIVEIPMSTGRLEIVGVPEPNSLGRVRIQSQRIDRVLVRALSVQAPLPAVRAQRSRLAQPTVEWAVP